MTRIFSLIVVVLCVLLGTGCNSQPKPNPDGTPVTQDQLTSWILSNQREIELGSRLATRFALESAKPEDRVNFASSAYDVAAAVNAVTDPSDPNLDLVKQRIVEELAKVDPKYQALVTDLLDVLVTAIEDKIEKASLSNDARVKALLALLQSSSKGVKEAAKSYLPPDPP